MVTANCPRGLLWRRTASFTATSAVQESATALLSATRAATRRQGALTLR